MRAIAPLAMLLAAVALGPLTAGEARAQPWVIDLGAGHSVHDPAQGAVNSAGVTLGFRHEGPVWLFASAGLPFDSGDATWAAMGGGGRFQSWARPLRFGIDVGAHGYGFKESPDGAGGSGLTGEAMPFVGLRSTSLAVEARSGAVHHRSSYGGASEGRTFHQTDARAALGAGPLVLVGEGRYLRGADGDHPYLGAGAEVTVDRLSLSGHAGSWLGDAAGAASGAVWGLTARARFIDRTEGYVGFRQEAASPLYRNAPYRSWTLGMSRRIGRPPVSPVPAALVTPTSGRVTIRLPLSASEAGPTVAGDFSSWREVPMIRDAEGWSVSLPLGPGVYRYAFRRPDGTWFVPEDTPGREPDGFGGFNAVLIVR